jgi:hypothetical protein
MAGREAFGQWLDAFVAAWDDINPVDPVSHACAEEMLAATVTMRARCPFERKASKCRCVSSFALSKAANGMEDFHMGHGANA